MSVGEKDSSEKEFRFFSPLSKKRLDSETNMYSRVGTANEKSNSHFLSEEKSMNYEGEVCDIENNSSKGNMIQIFIDSVSDQLIKAKEVRNTNRSFISERNINMEGQSEEDLIRGNEELNKLYEELAKENQAIKQLNSLLIQKLSLLNEIVE